MAEPLPDDELVDVYDDALNKVGVVTRNEAHRKGYWHLNLHCWIVTKRKGGAVIFQVRSEDKPTFSGLLDSTVGGHYKAGEQLEDVAREIKEEIGLDPDVKKLVPLGSRVDVCGLRRALEAGDSRGLLHQGRPAAPGLQGRPARGPGARGGEDMGRPEALLGAGEEDQGGGGRVGQGRGGRRRRRWRSRRGASSRRWTRTT